MIARIRPPSWCSESRRFWRENAEGRAHVLRRYSREGYGSERAGEEGAEGVGFLVGGGCVVGGAGEVVRQSRVCGTWDVVR